MHKFGPDTMDFTVSMSQEDYEDVRKLRPDEVHGALLPLNLPPEPTEETSP